MIVPFPSRVAATPTVGGIAMPQPKQIDDHTDRFREPDDPTHYWPDGAAIRALLNQRSWTRQQLLDIVNEAREKGLAMGVLERCLKSSAREPLKVKTWNLEAIADALGVDVTDIALSADEVKAAKVTWDDFAARATPYTGLELVAANDSRDDKRAGLELDRPGERPCVAVGDRVRIHLALEPPWAAIAAQNEVFAAVLWIDDRGEVSCVFPYDLASKTPGLVTGDLIAGGALIVPELSSQAAFKVKGPEGRMTLFAVLAAKPMEKALYERLLASDPRDGLDNLARAMAPRPTDQWALFRREFEAVAVSEQALGSK